MSRHRIRARLLILAILFAVIAPDPGRAEESRPPPLLVVLSDTGRQREDLPVLERHPAPEAVEETLLRGFSLRLLRLHRMARHYLWRRDGLPVEPAYLLLSDRQGGFPRYGFFLGEDPKQDVGYVDLHGGKRLTGRFGAIDQIFPHELMHVIVHLLAGEPGRGGANQIHAVGVRTDPQTAFNEGFAEHVQVMAVDDPDAAPETRALSGDKELRARAWESLERYEDALTALWAPASRARMTFPLWYSGVEQVLRYHAVKENLYALERPVPERLLDSSGACDAYLLENVLPGRRGGPLEPPRRLLSIEGVVSTLFHRWVTDEALRRAGAEPEIVDLFGPLADQADDLDAAYLKIFHALGAARPADTAALIRAYEALYPADASALRRVATSVLGRLPPDEPGPLWLANPWFTTGTSLFDQFRALPRLHTFDLNSSSMTELVAVPGVDRGMAREILRRAPFASTADLERVPGATPALIRSFEEMESRMRSLDDGTGADGLRLGAILLPFLWRALSAWIVAGAAAAALYGAVRRVAWWRAVANGLAAAFLGLAAGWLVDPGHGLLALAAPIVLLGLPAASWQLTRRAPAAGILRVLAGWAGAAIPAALIVRPWG